MSLIFTPYGGSVADAVNMPANVFITFGVSGTVYSGVKFGADGNLYERQAAGGWSRFGTWLFSGLASTYYLSRTIDTGTLTTDAGAGPLQMNTDRIYDIQETSNGIFTTDVSFDISNDVSGTPIIKSQSWQFEVQRGNL